MISGSPNCLPPIPDLLEALGLEVSRSSGAELRVKVCPFCEGKNDLAISTDGGAYHCHKCGAKGNGVTLAKHFGRTDLIRQTGQAGRADRIPARTLSEAISGGKPDKGDIAPLPDAAACHEALFKQAEAIEWLAERGINEETIRHFRLGFVSRGGEPWIVIPHVQDGEVRNVKFRAILEKKFQRVKGRPSILFNGDAIREKPAEVYVTEGEFDAMAMWQMGLTNTVALTNGAGKMEPEWYDLLKGYMDGGGSLILVCDNDKGRKDGNPGQEGAYDIARRLGLAEVRNYVLPDGAKDANEYMVAMFKRGQEFDEMGRCLAADIAERARAFPIRNSVELGEVIQEHIASGGKLLAVDTRRVIDFDSEETNRLFQNEAYERGFLPLGTLAFLMAPPKVGKTTFAQQTVLHNARKGLPCFDYCVEMSPRAKAALYMQQFIGHPPSYSSGEFERIKTELAGLPLVVGYNETGATGEKVLETMELVTARYGVKLIVFDNLQFLFRGKDEYSRVSEFSIQLKEAASRLNVAMLVILQPNMKSLRAGEMPDYTQVKTASDCAADCDFFMILHRNMGKGNQTGESVFAKDGKLRVISRESRGGTRDVCFDESSRMFFVTSRGAG